ncbi:MAG TPA: ABC transporter permease [Candidatus Acidoferrales bacterium]|nr:ABC transporter permease [Candidatus Acidoferrales bacterium]
MSFEWLVARRYLRSKHKPPVLRLVTFLSVVGVAAGVATLVIALAMNTGFSQAIRNRLLIVTAHINLKPNSTEGIRDYRQLMARLAKTPGVKSVTPAVYNTVLLSAHNKPQGIVLKGVDPPLETRADAALRDIVSGADNFAPDSYGIPGMIIGQILAQDMDLKVGDYVTVLSPQGSLTPFGMLPRSQRFRVNGIFNSGFYDYDANWTFITMQAAQKLAGVGDVVSLLEIRVNDLDRTNEIASEIAREAGPAYHTTTWMDENRALFRAMSLEKLVTAIFIGLITFVAGLNILVVLAMTVTEKAHDIAVLMMLGARRMQVRNIFVLQGFLVGVTGTGIGLAVGYALAWTLNRWQLVPLNPEVYAVPYVPFHSNAWDALWIAAAALAISTAATIYPARAASGTRPVEILRAE